MDVIWGPWLTQKVLDTRTKRVLVDESLVWEGLDYQAHKARRCTDELVGYLWEVLGVRVDRSHVVLKRVRREHPNADEFVVRWDPTFNQKGGRVMVLDPTHFPEPVYYAVEDVSEPLRFARQTPITPADWWRDPETLSGPAHETGSYAVAGWNETQGCWVFKSQDGKHLTLRDIVAMDAAQVLRGARP